MDDYYATLNVPVSADSIQVRTAYTHPARERHPKRVFENADD